MFQLTNATRFSWTSCLKPLDMNVFFVWSHSLHTIDWSPRFVHTIQRYPEAIATISLSLSLPTPKILSRAEPRFACCSCMVQMYF